MKPLAQHVEEVFFKDKYNIKIHYLKLSKQSRLSSGKTRHDGEVGRMKEEVEQHSTTGDGKLEGRPTVEESGEVKTLTRCALHQREAELT